MKFECGFDKTRWKKSGPLDFFSFSYIIIAGECMILLQQGTMKMSHPIGHAIFHWQISRDTQKNHICYHWLSVSGVSKLVHCLGYSLTCLIVLHWKCRKDWTQQIQCMTPKVVNMTEWTMAIGEEVVIIYKKNKLLSVLKIICIHIRKQYPWERIICLKNDGHIL